jgi:hypothetical protein
MIRIQHLGISILLFVWFSCTTRKANLLEVREDTTFSNNEFREYCNIDSVPEKLESNAVICSFVGDYKKALEFATKRARPVYDINVFGSLNAAGKDSLRTYFKKMMKSPSVSLEDLAFFEKALNLLERPSSLDSLFRNFTPYPAVEYIVNRASAFHYLLINEAHYSSSNRAFTTGLLSSLWERGFRYLALETLSHEDLEIDERGYPTINSGYYLRDFVFGNMVR